MAAAGWPPRLTEGAGVTVPGPRVSAIFTGTLGMFQQVGLTEIGRTHRTGLVDEVAMDLVPCCSARASGTPAESRAGTFWRVQTSSLGVLHLRFKVGP